MSFSTRPGYTASSQAAITSEIPDSDDGCIAYAIAEGTAWQLQKTSAATLGTNVIATKSGVGRWIRYQMATAAVASQADYLYGFGIDGAATLAVNTTPGDSKQYTTLAINAGIVLSIPNYALECSTSLTLAAGAIVDASGIDGTADSTGGAAGLAQGHLANGLAPAGGSGGSISGNGIVGSGGTRNLGGAGGAGGNNGPRTGGAAGTLGALTGQGIFDAHTLQWRTGGNPATFSVPQGGGTGGGGAGGASGPGGGGGSGAGLMIVRAKAISVALGALFRARGGRGCNRTTLDGSGGGGGGGGVIVVVCDTWTMPGGSAYADFFSVVGGAGGTSAGGLAGNAGSTGKVRLYVGGTLVYSLN